MLRFYYIFIFLITLCVSCNGQGKIELIKNGNTVFKIIYPKRASLITINGAKQLAIHLNRSSKAKFLVSEEKNADKYNIISVGSTSLFKDKIGDSVKSRLGKDGIIIKTVGRNLFLNGNTDQAELYAIYQFLEEYIKIDFWTPDVYDYPVYRNLVLDNINVQYSPPFFYRSHFIYNSGVSAEFSTILKENGEFQPLKDVWGKSIKFLGSVHTFSKILPPSKYFSKHPEWFADPANKYMPCTKLSKLPQDQETQLCLSDEKLKKEFLKQLLTWVKENPEYDLISVSQNDNKGFCHCISCTQIIEEEGGASGLLLRFINFMSVGVEKRYPNKIIETLAYFATESAPLKTKPKQNIVIRFAPIDANVGYPLNGKQNENVRRNLENWSNISNQIFYWGYNTNFSHALLPYPSLAKTLIDLKYLQKMNFKGIFIQDNTNPEGYGYFLDMQSWVIAKMMWNPYQDPDVLINRFFNTYYDTSGQYLLAYYKLIERAFKESGYKLLTSDSDYSYISETDIENAKLLFNKALAAASRNQKLKERIEKERLSFDFLLTYLGKKTGAEKGDFLTRLIDKNYPNEFVNNALKKYNSTLIEELETEDAKRSVKIFKKEISIEQGKFSLYRKGFATNIQYDPAAEDKLAATVSGESRDWAIQFVIKENELKKPAKFEVSSFLRVDKKTNENLAGSQINFGVYDPLSKKEILKKEISADKLAGSKYVNVTLGDVELKAGYVIWFSVGGTGNKVGHLFVDNINLKKK